VDLKNKPISKYKYDEKRGTPVYIKRNNKGKL
jgi:hypothetical protein